MGSECCLMTVMLSDKFLFIVYQHLKGKFVGLLNWLVSCEGRTKNTVLRFSSCLFVARHPSVYRVEYEDQQEKLLRSLQMNVGPNVQMVGL